MLIDDEGHAKLCDFGLAKYMEGGQSGLTTSNGLKGSIRFMGPEFFTLDHPQATLKSDNWAWCCLAIEVSGYSFYMHVKSLIAGARFYSTRGHMMTS